MSEQKCANCRFWLPDPQFYGPEWTEEVDGPMTEPGYCRRLPPVLLVDPGLHEANGFPSRRAHIRYPPTGTDFWCGEWQAANPTTVDDAAAVMARHVLAGDATAGRALADKLIDLTQAPAGNQRPK